MSLRIAGRPLLTLHTDDESRLPRALQALDYEITEHGTPSLHPLIIDRIS